MHVDVSAESLTSLSYKRFSSDRQGAVSMPIGRSSDGRLEYASKEPTLSQIGPRVHKFQDPSMLTPRRRTARTS